jgi:hypothetical protein
VHIAIVFPGFLARQTRGLFDIMNDNNPGMTASIDAVQQFAVQAGFNKFRRLVQTAF